MRSVRTEAAAQSSPIMAFRASTTARCSSLVFPHALNAGNDIVAETCLGVHSRDGGQFPPIRQVDQDADQSRGADVEGHSQKLRGRIVRFKIDQVSFAEYGCAPKSAVAQFRGQLPKCGHVYRNSPEGVAQSLQVRAVILEGGRRQLNAVFDQWRIHNACGGIRVVVLRDKNLGRIGQQRLFRDLDDHRLCDAGLAGKSESSRAFFLRKKRHVGMSRGRRIPKDAHLAFAAVALSAAGEIQRDARLGHRLAQHGSLGYSDMFAFRLELNLDHVQDSSRM